MTVGVIPRGGFEQRLASLHEQRIAILARIEEVEHWIALIDNLEAEQAVVEIPAPKRSRRKAQPS